MDKTADYLLRLIGSDVYGTNGASATVAVPVIVAVLPPWSSTLMLIP